MEENYTIDDFTGKETDKKYNYYILNKNCIIMRKKLDKEALIIKIDKGLELSEYISKINKHLQWLDTECRNEFIKYFIRKTGQFLLSSVYEELEINNVRMTKAANGNISTEIKFKRNNINIELIEIEEKTIMKL
jgi:hypothetical protein